MIYLVFTAAFLFFQDANPVAPPPVNNGSEVLEMLHNSGPVAMTVLGVLLVGSLFSWAIILGKWASFRRARGQSKRFLRAFRKASRLQEIAAVSEQFKPAPLVNVFDEVYETYRRQTGGFGPPRHITALERAAQTAASETLTAMEQRLTWLASIGAISPFVGLFGT
ncbi:MAG: MotA/TolQ/ExbB proton channel family protein, partial [Acidobacteriaceae bacterium]